MHTQAIAAFCILLVLQTPSTPSMSEQSQSSAQSSPASSSAQSAPPEPVILKQPMAFGIEDGTPIRLRLTRNLSSADAKTGDKVDFEVLDDLKVRDVLLIPRGGIAWATITEAEPKRRMGRAGKLDVNIDDVRLTDGEKAPLRAVKESKGGSHTGAMTGAMVATAIVFFPAAPLFLFMKGKDVTIPKGTEITAYVDGDISLDPVRFQPQPVVASSPTTPPSAEQSISSVDIRSTPDGADITIDGKYVGSTPSTLNLPQGDHLIRLEKAGFKSWEKTLTVGAAAAITINRELEKE
jgi:hypothetical protein